MAALSLSATGSRYLSKFSADWKARPPEMTIARGGQLRPVRFGQLGADEGRERRRRRRRDGLDRRRAASAARGGLEGGAAHGDHLLGLAAPHRLDGVAGIDRPLEGVGRDHPVTSEICMTSSRAATRGMTFLPKVVAGATRASYGRGKRNDQRRHRLGELMGEGVVVGDEHLGDAGEAWRLPRPPAGSPCRRRARGRRRRVRRRRSAPGRLASVKRRCRRVRQ